MDRRPGITDHQPKRREEEEEEEDDVVFYLHFPYPSSEVTGFSALLSLYSSSANLSAFREGMFGLSPAAVSLGLLQSTGLS